MYHLPQNAQQKTSRRKREREFFFAITRVLVYSDYLLLTFDPSVAFRRHA